MLKLHSVQLEQTQEGIQLHCNPGGDITTFLVDPSVLQSLILQGLTFIPSLVPEYTPASIHDAHRIPGKIFLNLDDRAIQLVLREVDSTTLMAFLWYMQDADILKKVLHNMSKRAGEMLMEDLENEWGNRDPDNMLRLFADEGQKAVSKLVSLLEKLIAEGQIRDYLSHLHPKKD